MKKLKVAAYVCLQLTAAFLALVVLSACMIGKAQRYGMPYIFTGWDIAQICFTLCFAVCLALTLYCFFEIKYRQFVAEVLKHDD